MAKNRFTARREAVGLAVKMNDTLVALRGAASGASIANGIDDDSQPFMRKQLSLLRAYRMHVPHAFENHQAVLAVGDMDVPEVTSEHHATIQIKIGEGEWMSLDATGVSPVFFGRENSSMDAPGAAGVFVPVPDGDGIVDGEPTGVVSFWKSDMKWYLMLNVPKDADGHTPVVLEPGHVVDTVGNIKIQLAASS